MANAFSRLNGLESGVLMGSECSAFSKDRKRARECVAQDREPEQVMARMEEFLSTARI